MSKGVEDSDGSGVPKVGADKSSASSDQAASVHATRRKPNEINAEGNVPAKIVSQEPPSIPAWATGLEADEVVKLDALIDEKGNVVETKLISGPRILQHEAERAVALWVFEPALSDGKPVATRMVLTVQFQN
jgi:outer membrane biosynthesis protein TonB